MPGASYGGVDHSARTRDPVVALFFAPAHLVEMLLQEACHFACRIFNVAARILLNLRNRRHRPTSHPQITPAPPAKSPFTHYRSIVRTAVLPTDTFFAPEKNGICIAYAIFTNTVTLLPTTFPEPYVVVTVTPPAGAAYSIGVAMPVTHAVLHGVRLAVLCMLAYRAAVRLAYDAFE